MYCTKLKASQRPLPCGSCCLTALKLLLTYSENWLGPLLAAGVPSALKRPKKVSWLLQLPHTFLLVSIEFECRFRILPHLHVYEIALKSPPGVGYEGL